MKLEAIVQVESVQHDRILTLALDLHGTHEVVYEQFRADRAGPFGADYPDGAVLALISVRPL